MRWTVLLGLWLCASAAVAAPLEFSAKPSIKREGRTTTIQFAMSDGADVEVAVLDAKGKVVRHLAAGVLGAKNPPPAPLVSGLSQSISWDGLDDFGDLVPDAANCSIRVRAGMAGNLDRVAGGDPYAYYSKEMGQGDHAAWRITGLEAKPDGKVYILGNANNYGPPALRQYDAAGDYLRTIYPPPAGKPVDQVVGWGIYSRDDETYSLQYNDLSSPALSTTIIAGTRGRIATLIPSPENDQLLLARDFELMRVGTDGTVSSQPLLEALLVNQPSLLPDAKNPKRGAWSLTGQMQVCLAPDGRHFYLGGIFAGTLDQGGSRIGAEATGFWRDGQIYKVNVATRTATVFFALDEDQVITDLKDRENSPIADARYGGYAALQGVATDSEGHVFVCDRQNERIVVLGSDGKIIRQIPLTYPDAIAVSPTSRSLFVTTRAGHYHGKGELKLVKFSDWTKDQVPSAVLPLCEVHHFSQPTYLTVAASQGDVFVWVAYTTLPVRVYRDKGEGLELVKDFYEAGTQLALDLQHFIVDARSGDALIADGFNRCFRLKDWDDPKFERCMQDENTPLEALSLAIDARGRWLYAHADRQPVARYRIEGKFFPPAPIVGSAGDNACTPRITNDWRIGLGHGDRGIAAALDGSLVTMNVLGTGADYSGQLRFFQANPNQVPWEGLLFKSFGERVRSAGVRFDLQGNLYAGKMDDRIPSPPPGIEGDANFLQSTGRIVKFSPTGSLKSESLFPVEPTGPAKVYDIQYGVIGPHFCRTPRFAVDGYGRIYYPTSLLPRVSVIDNEGNPIYSFGTYGNRDSLGGLPGDLVPTKDIPLAWPNCVDATDDYIYVSDLVNIRLLRIAKTFAVSQAVRIPD